MPIKNIFSFYEKKEHITEVIHTFVIEVVFKLYKAFLGLFLWLVPVVLATWEAETGESLEATVCIGLANMARPHHEGKTGFPMSKSFPVVITAWFLDPILTLFEENCRHP